MRRRIFALCFAAAMGCSGADVDEAIPKVLWRTPPRMTLEDWKCGPGGCELAPVAPFQFLEAEGGGSTVHFTVQDKKGRKYSVKFGAEVVPECFGHRFLYALGYLGEPTYYVAEGRIEGTGKLEHGRRFVKPDGSFTRARFQLRGQKDLEFVKDRTWSWVENPFLGTRELAGLKILMMLLSNWDAKDSRDPDGSNMAVFRISDHNQPALLYGMFDWGASLGYWGGLFRRDRADCSAYVKDSPHFVEREQGELKWGFSGKHAEDVRGSVTADDIRWLLKYLRPLNAAQIRTALQASGATERQASCWTSGIESRIRQLELVAK